MRDSTEMRLGRKLMEQCLHDQQFVDALNDNPIAGEIWRFKGGYIYQSEWQIAEGMLSKLRTKHMGPYFNMNETFSEGFDLVVELMYESFWRNHQKNSMTPVEAAEFLCKCARHEAAKHYAGDRDRANAREEREAQLHLTGVDPCKEEEGDTRRVRFFKGLLREDWWVDVSGDGDSGERKLWEYEASMWLAEAMRGREASQ